MYGLEYPEGGPPLQIELHCLLKMRYLTTLKISAPKICDSSKKGYFLSLSKFVESLRNTGELQVLHFYNGNIDSKNAVGMLRLLANNTSLGKLDLSGSSHLAEGDSEAVDCALERMLNANTTLKILALSGCGVRDPIAKHILTRLTKNTSLVTLDLGSCKLTAVLCHFSSIMITQHIIFYCLILFYRNLIFLL